MIGLKKDIVFTAFNLQTIAAISATAEFNGVYVEDGYQATAHS